MCKYILQPSGYLLENHDKKVKNQARKFQKIQMSITHVSDYQFNQTLKPNQMRKKKKKNLNKSKWHIKYKIWQQTWLQFKTTIPTKEFNNAAYFKNLS